MEGYFSLISKFISFRFLFLLAFFRGIGTLFQFLSELVVNLIYLVGVIQLRFLKTLLSRLVYEIHISFLIALAVQEFELHFLLGLELIGIPSKQNLLFILLFKNILIELSTGCLGFIKITLIKHLFLLDVILNLLSIRNYLDLLAIGFKTVSVVRILVKTLISKIVV